MKNIILTTLNARYSHTSLGLRYLIANLKELKEQTEILEFVINSSIQTIAEQILEKNPKIIGIAVYIWNAFDVGELVKTIKKVSPETIVVLGGPEVSYTPLRVNFDMADYIICGEGEVSFYELCKELFEGTCTQTRVINSPKVELDKVVLPYDDYTDFDIKNRHIYVEMARGCPFECEFCLSSIETKMRYLDIDIFLEQLDKLWNRGARNFKFIDRTFNIKISYAKAILNYFLAKEEEYFLHFEVIPDNFPEELRDLISKGVNSSDFISALTVCEPIYPAPPVTRIFILCSFPQEIQTYKEFPTTSLSSSFSSMYGNHPPNHLFGAHIPQWLSKSPAYLRYHIVCPQNSMRTHSLHEP